MKKSLNQTAKNVNSKNETNIKKETTNTNVVIKESSKNVDLFKDLNLDKTNLDELLNKIDNKKLSSKKETLGKRELYKKSIKDFLKESEYKSYKRKMRNNLKSFCNNIQVYFLKKESENLLKEINLFKDFYKSNYVLNDFSAESLRFNNADDDTKSNIDDTLEILKVLKIK